jgi:hypothetical protein
MLKFQDELAYTRKKDILRMVKGGGGVVLCGPSLP